MDEMFKEPTKYVLIRFMAPEKLVQAVESTEDSLGYLIFDLENGYTGNEKLNEKHDKYIQFRLCNLFNLQFDLQSYASQLSSKEKNWYLRKNGCRPL